MEPPRDNERRSEPLAADHAAALPHDEHESVHLGDLLGEVQRLARTTDYGLPDSYDLGYQQALAHVLRWLSVQGYVG
jgi:hypothetical protein